MPEMKLALQVTFKNMKHSKWVEDLVGEHFDKLDELFDGIISCRVVIDIPHKHHRKGNLFQVRIDLTVPGEEIVVNTEAGEHAAYEDIEVAVRDSFDSAKRLLEDYVSRKRGTVKTHHTNPHGRVVRLFLEEGYGFLETGDGRDVYFHSNSLIGEKLEHLEIGTEVTFAEEAGDKGPQASSVHVSRKQKKESGVGV
jgi:cold shock CspA family protein/ribosome-associated translation inhibitor RaiA